MQNNINFYFINFLKNLLGNIINNIYLLNNEIHCILNSENIYIFFFFLKYKSELVFKQLLDIWGVDYFKKEKRFEINYNLLNLDYNIRLRVKIFVNNFYFNLQSIDNLFKSAGWLEREVWDMFGIFFKEHFDLRRILTDYGFEGFPLRKDFPLIGFNEVYYSYKTKRIDYKSINIVKKMILYKNINPWI